MSAQFSEPQGPVLGRPHAGLGMRTLEAFLSQSNVSDYLLEDAYGCLLASAEESRCRQYRGEQYSGSCIEDRRDPQTRNEPADNIPNRKANAQNYAVERVGRTPLGLARDIAKQDGPESEEASENPKEDQNLSCKNNGGVRVSECLRQKKIHSQDNRLRDPDRDHGTYPATYSSLSYLGLLELPDPHRLN